MYEYTFDMQSASVRYVSMYIAFDPRSQFLRILSIY